MATPSEDGAEKVSGGLPQLDFDTWPSQIIWTAVALLALYQLLTKMALPRISGILETRADTIADDLDRAELLEQKAREASEAYDMALAEARASAQKIAGEARAKIQAEVDAAMAKADAEISARTAESEKRIGEIQAEAAENVKTVARDVAAALVEKLAPGGVDGAAVMAAVDSRT
ncbi:MAG: F0F1 ATP synthase subunit B' [Pseudomonadota bacterium]